MQVFRNHSQIFQLQSLDLPRLTPQTGEVQALSPSGRQGQPLGTGESLYLSPTGSSCLGEGQSTLPLLENLKAPLQSLVQGDKPVVKATGEIVTELVSHLVAPVASGAGTDKASSATPATQGIQPVVPVPPAETAVATTESTSAVLPDAPEALIKKGDELVKGTLLTVQAVRDKIQVEPSAATPTPQPLLKSVAVSTVAPIITSSKNNLQAVISGDKSVPEAVGAVASDALGAVVTGAASNVGQKLISAAAARLEVSPQVAEAAGVIVAFTSAQLSSAVLNSAETQMVVMDQTRDWLNRNLTGESSSATSPPPSNEQVVLP